MACTKQRRQQQVARVAEARTCPRLHLILCGLLALAVAMPTANARGVGFRAPDCQRCDVSNALKSLKTVAICNACGEMYGIEFERCCLCDKALYVTCVKAIQ
ncbi:hypothetical protein LSAT2_022921 [Lamellibrachia satsuma]|nr:hypothetical protein LSAT2_022921 [Lamellibrachia satsuma]